MLLHQHLPLGVGHVSKGLQPWCQADLLAKPLQLWSLKDEYTAPKRVPFCSWVRVHVTIPSIWLSHALYPHEVNCDIDFQSSLIAPTGDLAHEPTIAERNSDFGLRRLDAGHQALQRLRIRLHPRSEPNAAERDWPNSP